MPDGIFPLTSNLVTPLTDLILTFDVTRSSFYQIYPVKKIKVDLVYAPMPGSSYGSITGMAEVV